MSGTTCAYCDNPLTSDNRTKEHVVNKSFLNNYYQDTKGYANCYNKITSNYLTIGDVCNVCNNEVLSLLDSYFLEFYEAVYNEQIITPTYKVKFNYDFDRLSRWLLKTLYNSERKNGYDFIPPILHQYRDYITGKNKQIDFKVIVELLLDENPDLIKKHSGSKITKLDFFRISNQVFGTHTRPNTIKFIAASNIVFHVVLPDLCTERSNDILLGLFKHVSNTGDNLFEIRPDGNEIEITPSKRTIIDIFATTIEGDKRFNQRVVE
jgi:hypothetical protein